MDIRRVCTGHYSDHGLGRELQWYPDETVITTPGGRLTVTDGGYTARVTYRPAGAARSIDLTGRAPEGLAHDALVAHWADRLARFAGELEAFA